MEISKKEEENIIYQRTFNKKPFTYVFLPLIIGLAIAVLFMIISYVSQTTDGRNNINNLAAILFSLGAGSTITMLVERMWVSNKAVKEYKEQINKGEK